MKRVVGIYIYIYMVTPPQDLHPPFPYVCTGCFPTLVHDIGTQHRKLRYNPAFCHVHANSADICRRLDMRLNPVPNLGPNLMIVSVLEKPKLLEGVLFLLMWC